MRFLVDPRHPDITSFRIPSRILNVDLKDDRKYLYVVSYPEKKREKRIKQDKRHNTNSRAFDSGQEWRREEIINSAGCPGELR